MASEKQGTTLEVTQLTNVVNEVSDEVKVGEYVGQCKWFNDRYGYGFITIQSGEEKGKDIFVHHTGVKPLNSNYKTLKKGEYVSFNIINGENGLQAVDVTGVGGGSLMCDVMPSVKFTRLPSEMQMPPSNFTTVTYKRADMKHHTNAQPRRAFNSRSIRSDDQ